MRPLVSVHGIRGLLDPMATLLKRRGLVKRECPTVRNPRHGFIRNGTIYAFSSQEFRDAEMRDGDEEYVICNAGTVFVNCEP